ncbi:BolA family protein [Buchnera aphidicola]|uniref:BolA family protein n=1 Tax=Buchnera aphidicola TaxID=9 RepID=UPI003464DECA
MNTLEIESCIKKAVELNNIYIIGDLNHIKIIAIGNIFIGMNNVQKQQIIYKPITKYIMKKKIHAISIYTFTLKEWEKKKGNFFVN